MDLTCGHVIYQLDAHKNGVSFNIIWRGVPIKRFSIRVPLEQVAQLAKWLDRVLKKAQYSVG